MRIRLPFSASHYAASLAKALDRSPSQVTAIALFEMAEKHLGARKQRPDDEIDKIFSDSKVIACRARGQIRDGVERFAQLEDRSLSNAINVLLRDGLKQRGLLPTGADTTA
jgi:hypothetical protein